MELIYSKDDVIIDFSPLQDLLGTDTESYEPIVRIFLTNVSKAINDIKSATASKNWEEVYKAAHFAKSSLAVIKVNDYHKLMIDIETKAKTKSGVEFIPADLVQLENHWPTAQILIEEWLQTVV